jgi:hypothetical protein
MLPRSPFGLTELKVPRRYACQRSSVNIEHDLCSQIFPCFRSRIPDITRHEEVLLFSNHQKVSTAM